MKGMKDKLELSLGQKRMLVFAILLVFIIQIAFLFSFRKVKKHQQIDAAKIYGESVAAGIVLSMEKSINATQVLKDLYLEYGYTFFEDFDRICKRLSDDNQTIASLYLAPNAIIRKAYPKSIEESTLGFEMLKDPAQADRALMAIETGKITVAGPHKLVEGGTGFIIRNPIFINDQFDAFTIAILDWNKYVDQLLLQISQKDSGYKFAVWKASDVNAVTDENGFIFKNCTEDVSRLIDIEIPVPNDIWHLAVEPINGWTSFASMIHEIIISSMIVIILGILIHLRQMENTRNLYNQQHDELTGLLHRGAFLNKVDELLENNPDIKFNVIAADIENFKVTNSIYGTKKGDEILKYLAASYLCLNTDGFCSRYGGDQFLCIVPVCETSESNKSNKIQNNKTYFQEFESIEEIANKISSSAPVPNLTVKYGFYGNVDKSLPANLICDRALLASRSILHNYEKIVANYEGPLSKQNMREQMLESSFVSAIQNGDFKVWFQPKFDTFTEKLVGAEALVRWIKADGTVVAPVDFIHVFEQDGLIYKLDLYVFEKVCQLMKEWQNKGFGLIPISINISRMSLRHRDAIKEYEKILNRIGLAAEYVPLEITETSSSSTKQIEQLTRDLKDSGFVIHMDDFGTGLSSLESLNILPFDTIKLDKSLIDFIGTPDGNEMLRHLIELLRFKNLKIIAEGVETKDQLEYLRALKCDHIQGYYFSAPMSYEKFIDFVKEFNRENKIAVFNKNE